MKKTLFIAMTLFSLPVFSAPVTYTCPPAKEIVIKNFDGEQWQLSADLIKRSTNSISKVKITTYMPIKDENKKPAIEEFDTIGVNQWSGGPQLIGCHYFAAPSLHTDYSFNPGNNCKVINLNTVECN